jgi:hypothetical protein
MRQITGAGARLRMAQPWVSQTDQADRGSAGSPVIPQNARWCRCHPDRRSVLQQHARDAHGLSERRVCRLVKQPRGT